ncbi:hypothetical protein [Acetobacter orleanensis]|nr:hypothetical protein [Acetobacter orleanensis]
MTETKIPAPRKRGRPAKTGKPMSALERQKRRQALTGGITDAVIEVMARPVHKGWSSTAGFLDNAFVRRSDISFQFTTQDVLSFIPVELHDEFWSRIQLSIARKSFQHDLRESKKNQDVRRTMHATVRFRDVFIWELVYGTMFHRNEYDRPIQKALDILPFIVNGIKPEDEQKYIDIYVAYRSVYDAEWNTHCRQFSEQQKKQEEYSPAMKAHTTRMANIRKEVISYETQARSRREKYDQQLDRDLFKEECIAIAYSLSDEELKARHKEIQTIRMK